MFAESRDLELLISNLESILATLSNISCGYLYAQFKTMSIIFYGSL